MSTDDAKPLIDFPAKKSVFRVYPTTELISEAARGEERNANRPRFKDPTFPSDPDIKVEDSRAVR